MAIAAPQIKLDDIRGSSEKLQAVQDCLDHLTRAGAYSLLAGATDAASLETDDSLWRWTVPTRTPECRLQPRTRVSARELLSGHHIFFMGDLHARLLFSALVYQLNGTAGADEVAAGFPQHRNPSCWSPDGIRRGGYSFGGWDHIKRSSPCHLRFYGASAGTLHNLTLKHAPGSKAWWGRGTSRDVMTLLLRDKLLHTTYRAPPLTNGDPGAIVTYLWKGVVRTAGSYKSQHARHVAQVAAKVGVSPTVIVAAMGTYDSQWQTVGEVSGRLEGLFEGLAARWPATAAGSPLLLFSGSSSCTHGKKYSVYMGKDTRNNHFKNMPNASALIPYARRAAANRSVLFLDTAPVLSRVPPLRTSPCHYDLPLGLMAETLIQITLSALSHRPGV
jgi:hypothetical protein